MSADVELKMTTILKEMRDPATCSKSERTLVTMILKLATHTCLKLKCHRCYAALISVFLSEWQEFVLD